MPRCRTDDFRRKLPCDHERDFLKRQRHREWVEQRAIRHAQIRREYEQRFGMKFDTPP